MADLAITPANVRSYGTDKETLTAAGTITAGMAVMKNGSGQVVAGASDSAANAAVYGIALHGASANQPCTVQKTGTIDMGGTLAVGKPYVLGTASGTVKPVDDIAGTEYVTVIGVASATNRLELAIRASGVVAAGAVA